MTFLCIPMNFKYKFKFCTSLERYITNGKNRYIFFLHKAWQADTETKNNNQVIICQWYGSQVPHQVLEKH